MAEVVVAQRMWQRRDTAANWTSVNPVLAAGEIGVELGATSGDPQKFKIGNGVTDWNTLAYAGGGIPDAPSDGTTYGRKDGAWAAVGTGGGGSTWYDGTGAPGGGLGVDGDYYLDDATGNVYAKVGGSWSVVANIKGAPGADGDDGADGDSAYQIALNNGYVGSEASWLASLQGAPGADGDDGDPGPAGGPFVGMTTSGNITASAASHKGKILWHTAGIITLDPTATAGFAVDDEFCVSRESGSVGFAAGVGVTLDYNTALYDASEINALKDVVLIHVKATDVYRIIGPLTDA